MAETSDCRLCFNILLFDSTVTKKRHQEIVGLLIKVSIYSFSEQLTQLSSNRGKSNAKHLKWIAASEAGKMTIYQNESSIRTLQVNEIQNSFIQFFF